MRMTFYGLCVLLSGRVLLADPGTGDLGLLLRKEASLGDVTLAGDFHLRVKVLDVSLPGGSLDVIHKGFLLGYGVSSTWALAWIDSRIFTNDGVPYVWITPLGFPANPSGDGTFRYGGRKWLSRRDENGIVRMFSGSLWCDYANGVLVRAGVGSVTAFELARAEQCVIGRDGNGAEMFRIELDAIGRPSNIRSSASMPVTLHYNSDGRLETVVQDGFTIMYAEYNGSLCSRVWKRNGEETVLRWEKIEYDPFRPSPYWFVASKDGWIYRTRRSKTLLTLTRTRGTRTEALEYDILSNKLSTNSGVRGVWWRTWPSK